MTNLLSRIYDAANNVVTADVDNQSVSTEDLDTINYPTLSNNPSESHDQLLAFIDTGAVNSISETISDVPRSTFAYTIVEVISYRDDEGGENNNLQMTIGGVSDENYNYVLEDENLTANSRTGQNEFVLIEPTATQDSDAHAGRWELFTPRARVSIIGRGAPSQRGAGRALAKGSSVGGTGAPNDPFDITFVASAVGAGDDLHLTVAVWQTNDRGDI